MKTLHSRREMLTTMSSGIGWLAFSALAQAKSGLAAKQPHFAPRAKRVIFLTMRGGPSHVDLFDHKPELIKRDGKTASLGRDSSGAKLEGAYDRDFSALMEAVESTGRQHL